MMHTGTEQKVWCEKHNPKGTPLTVATSHYATDECVYPCFADRTDDDRIPSMTAVETLNPLEAVWL